MWHFESSVGWKITYKHKSIYLNIEVKTVFATLHCYVCLGCSDCRNVDDTMGCLVRGWMYKFSRSVLCLSSSMSSFLFKVVFQSIKSVKKSVCFLMDQCRHAFKKHETVVSAA